jgi:hypothetical protein
VYELGPDLLAAQKLPAAPAGMAFGGEGGPDPSKFDFLVGDDFGVWQNKTMEGSSIVVEQSGIPGCAQILSIPLILKGVHLRPLNHPQLEVGLPVLMLSCPAAANRTVSACAFLVMRKILGTFGCHFVVVANMQRSQILLVKEQTRGCNCRQSALDCFKCSTCRMALAASKLRCCL